MRDHLRSVFAFSFVFFFAVPLARAENSNPPPPGRAELLAESLPHIKSWQPAAFPQGMPSDVTTGNATVRIIVDETGKITSARVLEATETAFGEAALEAVKTWTFSPGVEHGKHAAMCLDVPMEFSAGAPPKPRLLPPDHLLPKPAPRMPAGTRFAPLGEYPLALRERGLLGRVLFRCRVTPAGKPQALQIVAATHADFVLPGISAFERWEFQPAMAGDLAVESEIGGEISFGDLTASRAETLAKNGITAPDGSAPADEPMPRVVVEPVWPYAALLEGESGSAVVQFTVTPNGRVIDVAVTESSHADFGAAALAAMQAWVFEPALRDGQGVDVRLQRRVEFVVPTSDSPESEDLARLVGLAKDDKIAGGAGLDARLSPLFRVMPLVPKADDGSSLSGETRVEFVVDRTGRVRLPNVLSATDPRLGWAASTALGQWIFKAPTRGGEPTDVKVTLPMKF